MLRRLVSLGAVVVFALLIPGRLVDAKDLRIPDAAVQVELSETIDGDTFDADFNLGSGENISRIRMIGIDTPETSYSYGNFPECYGEQAKIASADALDTASEIWLEEDVTNDDGNGRLLRYVWIVDSEGKVEFLNELLVLGGYAEAKTYEPNTTRQQTLDGAEREAIDGNAGLWAGCDSENNSYAESPGSDESDNAGSSDNASDQNASDETVDPADNGTEASCAIFASYDDAQLFYQEFPEIADRVDPDGNGVACETWYWD